MSASRWVLSAVVVAWVVLLPAGLDPNAVVQAAPAETMKISGVVRESSTERPLTAYVQVSIQGSGGGGYYNETKSDPYTGEFSLEVAEGEGWIYVVATDGKHSPYQRPISPSDSGGRLVIHLDPYPPMNARVEGVVLDSETREPIGGATVHLSSGIYYAQGAPSPSVYPIRCCGPSDDNTTSTGPDGRFRFDAYPGRHVIEASAEGYATEMKEVFLEENRTTEVLLALQRIPPENAIVRGVVRDRQTGLAVVGASVSVWNMEWARYNGTTTDERGSFEVRTLRGYSSIRVEVLATPEQPVEAPPSLSERKEYYSWSTSLGLKEGVNDLAILLVPKPPPTVTVVGYAVNSSSLLAIRGAWIWFQNEATGEWGSATTGEDGSYRIRVRPGYFSVSANAEGYFSNFSVWEITEPSGVLRHDVLLEPGRAHYAPRPLVVEAGASPESFGSSMPPPSMNLSLGKRTFVGGEGNLGRFDGRVVLEGGSGSLEGPLSRTPLPPISVAGGALLLLALLRRRNRTL